MLAAWQPGSTASRSTGELSDIAGQAFEGMTLTRGAGTTLLVGRLRDQAELHGVLQRVSDLGLTLLNATVVDEGEET